MLALTIFKFLFRYFSSLTDSVDVIILLEQFVMVKVHEFEAFLTRVDGDKLDQRHTGSSSYFTSVSTVNSVSGENLVFILSLVRLIRHIDNHKVNDAH